MTIHSERLHYLVRRYTDKTCTPAEMQELFALVAGMENRESLQQIFDQHYGELITVAETSDIDWDTMFASIRQQQSLPVRNGSSINMTKRWLAAAAAIIILLGAATWFLFFNKPQAALVKKNEAVQPVLNDIAPGGNKAILVMADGMRVPLDEANNKNFTEKNGVLIRNANGQIVYNTGAVKSAEMVYNTVYVPRKGQYQLVLADGSKVWLNAESSIRYPVAFAGNERRVEITGECYFEIAPVFQPGDNGKKVPFIVKMNTPSGDGGEVEVLGTHFNIMAYHDESSINITLLEGSVNIKRDQASGLLKAGQQAQLSGKGIKVINNADADQAVAWKNGLFKFKSTSIQVIMRQIARWYDVDVIFEGGANDERFSGTVPRSENVSEVLKLLELTNTLHFSIDGKKIVVGSGL